MKKSNFLTLTLGTVSVLFFALGMCMALLPEWGVTNQGIVSGVIGLVLALFTVVIWRKMEGKAPVKISKKIIGAVLLGAAGALLLGAGMYLCMVSPLMIFGTGIGIIGIAVWLSLIPLLKGLHD